MFRKSLSGVAQSWGLQPISPCLGSAFASFLLSQPGRIWILAGTFSHSIMGVFTLFLNSCAFSWMNDLIILTNCSRCPDIVRVKILQLQPTGRWSSAYIVREIPQWRNCQTKSTFNLTVPLLLIVCADPYVKVSLMCDGRRLKKRKTSTKRNTLNPVYNEAIVFDVPPENIDQIHLSIAVMDYDRWDT